jgi:hypothetical protein
MPTPSRLVRLAAVPALGGTLLLALAGPAQAGVQDVVHLVNANLAVQPPDPGGGGPSLDELRRRHQQAEADLVDANTRWLAANGRYFGEAGRGGPSVHAVIEWGQAQPAKEQAEAAEQQARQELIDAIRRELAAKRKQLEDQVGTDDQLRGEIDDLVEELGDLGAEDEPAADEGGQVVQDDQPGEREGGATAQGADTATNSLASMETWWPGTSPAPGWGWPGLLVTDPPAVILDRPETIEPPDLVDGLETTVDEPRPGGDGPMVFAPAGKDLPLGGWYGLVGTDCASAC